METAIHPRADVVVMAFAEQPMRGAVEHAAAIRKIVVPLAFVETPILVEVIRAATFEITVDEVAFVATDTGIDPAPLAGEMVVKPFALDAAAILSEKMPWPSNSLSLKLPS